MKIMRYKPNRTGTTRLDPVQLKQEPHYYGKEIDEQIAAVFPNYEIDSRIAQAFEHEDPIADLRREQGIDPFIYQEIQNGKLDKVLQEYAD